MGINVLGAVALERCCPFAQHCLKSGFRSVPFLCFERESAVTEFVVIKNELGL